MNKNKCISYVTSANRNAGETPWTAVMDNGRLADEATAERSSLASESHTTMILACCSSPVRGKQTFGSCICKKLNIVYSSLRENHSRATECHLPYGITECDLPPDS